MQLSAADVDPYRGLAGRPSEIRRLRQLVERLDSGHGHTVGLAGTPGIGKSTLLAALAGDARSAGLATVVATSGLDLPGVLDRTATDAGPLVVVLDDVHLVPPELAPTLAALIEVTVTRPVLLAFGYRPRQLPDVLAAVLARAETGRLLRTCQLGPLSLAGARELLGDHPDLERLHRDGEGNPLYLRALADPSGPAGTALVGELSALRPTELRTAQVAAVIGASFTPDLLVDVAPTSEAETLPALDRLVAADILRPAGPAHLEFRHRVVAAAVYNRVDVSLRRTIHRRVEAALATAGAPTTRRAHHIAHAADLTRPGHTTTLLAGAGELLHRDPATAAVWLTTASALLPPADPHWVDAQVLLAEAHLLLGRPDESRRSPGPRRQVPRPTAPQAASQTAPPAPPGPPGPPRAAPPTPAPAPPQVSAHTAARLALIHGRANRLLGHRREAWALFVDGLRAAGIDATDAVSLHTEIAQLTLDCGNLSTAVRHATTAIDLARGHAGRANRAGPVGTAGPTSEAGRTSEASALAVAAHVWLHTGEAGHAVAAATAAAHLVDAMPDAELIRDLACPGRLGAAESALDRLPDAERHLARGLALSDDTGQTHVRGELLTSLADVRLRRGRLRPALDSLTEARRATSPEDVPRAVLIGMIEAEVLLWLGGPHPVADVVAAAEHVLVRCDATTGPWAVLGRVSSAGVLLRVGQEEHGVRLLRAAATAPDATNATNAVTTAHPSGLPATRRAWWWELLVEGAVRAGDAAAAVALAGRAAADLPAAWSTSGRGHVLRAQMRAAAAEGDVDRVLSLARDAGACFAEADMPLEDCRTLVDATRICLAAGRTEGTDARLGRARVIASHIGSQRLLDDVDALHALREHLDTPPPAEPAAESVLTEREARVAVLASAGMRSREIAGRLSISTRTVDAHLGRIYRKLGVSNRTELARMDLRTTGDGQLSTT